MAECNLSLHRILNTTAIPSLGLAIALLAWYSNIETDFIVPRSGLPLKPEELAQISYDTC